MRHGKITEFDPPARLSFEQPMTMRPEALGVVGILLSHVLTPGSNGVHLLRALDLTPRGRTKFAMPLLILAFRKAQAPVFEPVKRSYSRSTQLIRYVAKNFR